MSGGENAGTGFVSLVGAGPGAADLITVRGRDRIARADAIVYDDLVDDRLLADARPGVELVYAGKRGWREGPERPDTGALLVRLARQDGGRRVVRLKGGDPMVFGRGGEEAEALAAAGVPFEVVPGVTAALAASAASGIPLTYRGVSAAVTLVTGQAAAGEGADEGDQPRTAELAALALAGGTLCVYMGLRALRTLAPALIERGVAPDLQVAVVSNASLPHESVVTGRLASIADLAEAAGSTSPALVMIGAVVGRRQAPTAPGDTDQIE